MHQNWKRNLWIIWVAQVLSLGGFNFGLPFLPYFIQDLGVTDSDQLKLWTGIISSAPALTMAVMAPIWGFIADRYGRKIMLLRAMLFGTVILTALSFVTSVEQVIILRLLQGLLTGTMTAAATLVSVGTPKEKLSYALGVLASSNFIGISIGPLFGGLAAEWLGYRMSFVIGAAILAVGFFLVLIAVQELKAPEEDNKEEIKERESGNRNHRNSIFTFTIIGSLAMILILRFSRVLPIPFIPLYVQDLLGKISGAASITGLISFARGGVTALASITIVRWGDKIERMKIVVLLLALATIVSIPVSFVQSIFGFSVFFVLATFFMGGIEPLIQSEIVSAVPSDKRGLIFGVQTTVGNMGWFAAPMIGSLISINYGIPAVFFSMLIFLAVATLIAFIFLILLRNKRTEG
ncbi:MFS transporter [Spirochaeta cellobiosiphila]|uniref:MFS transporter n=1 Tax=Spirochaeta cellobiosiphila TaxID=504483 RepID=UPI0003F6F388|nr:MFS transporter [Spirochaeta cellobiosiphila]